MTNQADVLAILNPIEDNEDRLRMLVGQLKTTVGVIPFVGAGLSIPFGFPGWHSFLIDQARRSGVEEQIKGQLDAGEYEDAAEALQKARGYRAFHDAIGSAFGSHRLAGKQLTGAVTYLPNLAAGPIITTNFDRVLEEVFERAGKRFELVVWGVKADSATSALHQNRRFLLKIHGDAEDSTDRVLTKTDYERQYGSMDGSSIDFTRPLPRLLQQMLISRPLLFLGCSLSGDRTVAVLDKVAQGNRSIAHYAIVEQPAESAQFYERARFLSDHNVRPIWYPTGRHDLVAPLLAYLISASTGAPVPGPAPQPIAPVAAGEPAQPPANSTPLPDPKTISAVTVRKVLVESFSLDEIGELCFDITAQLQAAGIQQKVDLDTIGRGNKSTTILNLIGFLDRRGYLHYLVTAIRHARGGII